MSIKQGGNRFHGSGWWFGQRSALDANELFNEANGGPKPDHVRDQYGFSLGGPIKNNKTFFFVDFEALRQNDPFNIDAFVPTALERAGDFRNSLQPIFNPFSFDSPGVRSDFTTPNVIDPGLIDPIGQKIINLYPQPTDPNAAPGDLNFHKSVLIRPLAGSLTSRSTTTSRTGIIYLAVTATCIAITLSPLFSGTATGGVADGLSSITNVHNASLEDSFTISPNVVWTNRFALDRAVSPVTENYPKFDTVFDQPGDAPLGQANHLTRFPTIQMDNNATSLFNQCCTDTTFAHTLYSYSSSLSWARGRQIWKFGGEQRLFFNNFFQPGSPTGFFHLRKA